MEPGTVTDCIAKDSLTLPASFRLAPGVLAHSSSRSPAPALPSSAGREQIPNGLGPATQQLWNLQKKSRISVSEQLLGLTEVFV